jgi:DNA-binding PadR family transcriptional regulator
MSSTSYRSPWALTILSLLDERPMHPYEIRRLVRQRGRADQVDLRPGSLYRTIERLERAGLVEPVETTRQGRFPERTIYRLSEHGQEELYEWMRELLSTPMKDFPQLLGALSVLAILEPDDARAQLEGRVIRLEGEIAAMETQVRRLRGVLPRLFMVEAEYAIVLRKAELDWVKELVEDLRTGRLSWSRAELKEGFGSGDRPLDLRVVDSEQEGVP